MQADTNSVAPRFSSRLRPRAEDGFGIIEVLVSAILVVIVSTGVFVAFDGASNASATNKARSAASNIARSDQERLRGMTAQQLAALPSGPQTQTVDRRDYYVTSTTQWVADRTGTPTCNSADARADYLKLRTSVGWSGMGSANPVVVDSLRAIPRGAFRPDQGSIAVKITDRNGTGVPGATVSITGTQGYNTTTNANGCVLIDQVPTGTYTATITKSGFVVDKYPNPSSYVKTFNVAKEQTSSVLGTMDLAGTGRVSFRTTTAACTTTCTEAATTGEGFTMANSGLVNPTTINYTLATATATNANLYTGDVGVALTTSTTKDVFPFTGAYRVWAGACDEANPANYDNPQPPVDQIVPPGALTAATPTGNFYVREPFMNVNVRRYTASSQLSTATSNVTSQKVTITPNVPACARAVSLTTNGSGLVTQSLPYGAYTICAQDSTATNARRVRVTRTNGVFKGTNFTALYNGNATPPFDGAIILPFATANSTPC